MSYSHSATPFWLWIVLALVVWRAVRSLRPRIMSVTRLLILPALFSVWSLGNIEQRVEGHAVSFVLLAVAIVVGLWAGWIVGSAGAVRADHERGLVERPGGIIPLIVVLVSLGGKLLFFSGGSPGTVGTLFSIALLGLLWGRTLHYGIRYMQAPQTPLGMALN
ncbi:hypothetical protein BWP39_00470 [Paraburkholderia acidicola]|uniref:DUF1453 domain-containing protein n=1 Tax=Paraburkholderia acidicola TaxID=1912599 RepID=A0A2A4F6V8_9BURK|nr:hypothetical protein BWP39_00470 [Paraburkholderia acidicola]